VIDPAGSASGVTVASCGCLSPPRRVCDLCGETPVLACSAACLKRHQADVHGGTLETAAWALQHQAGVNRNFHQNWRQYAWHRERLMSLIAATSAGGDARDICIFGAGNCNDLDTERLAAAFSSIHLVDIDPEALERGRESFPASRRDGVVLHSNIDLSGFVDRLDEWGDRFPDDRELGRAALEAIQRILRQIGGRCDVVLSTCVLSQLPIPFRRTWVTSASNWKRLHDAITAVHLATLAATVQPGGHGLMAFDLFGSRRAAGLLALEQDDGEAIQAFVEEQVRAGVIRLDWDPAAILERLKSPSLRTLVESPRLTLPWLWNTGDTLVVYGLEFRRPQAHANP
jgi:hypothetical protein